MAEVCSIRGCVEVATRRAWKACVGASESVDLCAHHAPMFHYTEPIPPVFVDPIHHHCDSDPIECQVEIMQAQIDEAYHALRDDDVRSDLRRIVQARSVLSTVASKEAHA